jgi:hypothetical protein
MKTGRKLMLQGGAVEGEANAGEKEGKAVVSGPEQADGENKAIID